MMENRFDPIEQLDRIINKEYVPQVTTKKAATKNKN